jgi:hypothetical protein
MSWHLTRFYRRHWWLALVEKTNVPLRHDTTWSTYVDAVTKGNPVMTTSASSSPKESSSHSSRKDRFFATLVTETPPKPILAWFEAALAKEKERYALDEADRKRRSSAFEEMLTEYFFRSDHVEMTWHEAKRKIAHRSSFKAMEAKHDDMEAAFEAYMEKLRAKMPQVLKTRHKKDAKDTMKMDVIVMKTMKGAVAEEEKEEGEMFEDELGTFDEDEKDKDDNNEEDEKDEKDKNARHTYGQDICDSNMACSR